MNCKTVNDANVWARSLSDSILATELEELKQNCALLSICLGWQAAFWPLWKGSINGDALVMTRKNLNAVMLGRLGAKARNRNLSPEERSEISRKAGKAGGNGRPKTTKNGGPEPDNLSTVP